MNIIVGNGSVVDRRHALLVLLGLGGLFKKFKKLKHKALKACCCLTIASILKHLFASKSIHLVQKMFKKPVRVFKKRDRDAGNKQSRRRAGVGREKKGV